MASVLMTNMASISAQRYLTNAQNKLGGQFEKLSSGSRINRAQDDAAGMGISQKLTASINTTSVSIRNANDAIGIAQTAEGALAEISSMLQRFKELATQGMNGALSNDQRAYLSVEMGNLAKEIVAISDRTTFNGNKLLSSTGDLTFQTGPELNTATKTGIVEISKVNLQSVGANDEFTNLYEKILAEGEITDIYFNDDGTGKINATSQFSSYSAYADAALTEVATLRAKFGTTVTRLNHNIANLTALHENLSAANSRVVDTDYAAETANLTKTQILQQAATAMLSQANAQPNVVLALLK